jgi:hypothetical protein
MARFHQIERSLEPLPPNYDLPVAIRIDRFTSIRDVSAAQIPVIARGCAEWVKSTLSTPSRSALGTDGKGEEADVGCARSRCF